MPKKAIHHWKKVAIGYELDIDGRVAGHVWQGADKLWRGATVYKKVSDNDEFGPFDTEGTAREALLSAYGLTPPRKVN